MALMEAKCTNCGGKLQIDNKKEAAVCPYCGSAFIVEKGIQLYNQSCNVYGEKISIYKEESQQETATELYNTGMKALEATSYDLAMKCFNRIKENYPSDYRGALGLLQYWYKQEGVINKEYLDKEYREASLLANSEEQREKVSSIYKLVQNKYKRIEEKRQAEEDENWEKLIGEAEGKYKEAKIGLFGLIAWTIIYIILFLILKSNESTIGSIIAFFLGIGLVPFVPTVIYLLIQIIKEIENAKRHLDVCLRHDSNSLYWEWH